MVRVILEHLKGYTPVDIILHSGDEVSDFISAKVAAIVSRVLADEPLQYVLGDTRFYGMTVKVTPDTLIPRPETEELVDIIVKENRRPDLRVLDVGTGSGCIAIALARNLPFAKVGAIDISDGALAVARENAEALKASVTFRREDALHLEALSSPAYDIIVSNPPYVTMSERKDMEANVLGHEPSLALFVPDDDPLRFYKAITDYAVSALDKGGRLYFEINPLFATDMQAMVTREGLDNVTLLRDMTGRYRFLTAAMPE